MVVLGGGLFLMSKAPLYILIGQLASRNSELQILTPKRKCRSDVDVELEDGVGDREYLQKVHPPEIRNTKPDTRNLKPETRNPKPETPKRNPKPEN